MNPITQSIIDDNRRWKQKNLDMLTLYLAYRMDKKEWPALITLAQWGKSEKQRLQVWESAVREFHLTEPDPLQEEEAALILAIEETQERINAGQPAHIEE